MPEDKLTQTLIELQQARLSLIRRALAMERQSVAARGALRLWRQLTLATGLLSLNHRLRRAEALLEATAITPKATARSSA